MERRTNIELRLWALLAVAAAVAIGAMFLLFSARHGFPQDSRQPPSGGPPSAETRDTRVHSASEFVLYRGASAEAPAYVVADVAVDEDFVIQVGDEWKLEIEQTLEAANALLAPVGLRIEMGSIQRWRSAAIENDIPAHVIWTQLKSAEQQADRNPGYLLLAITGQYTPTYDGFALRMGSSVIVRRYQEYPERTAALVLHEVGHLLGAKHHADEEQCAGHGCFMTAEGFAHATDWCDHHREAIQDSIASIMATQGSEI